MIRGMTAHTAASSGDLKVLIAIATKDPELIKAKDHNGWTPLHEAVRGGHLECVKFLINSGLDKVSSCFFLSPARILGSFWSSSIFIVVDIRPIVSPPHHPTPPPILVLVGRENSYGSWWHSFMVG
jgi:ankyrin repeat protein